MDLGVDFSEIELSTGVCSSPPSPLPPSLIGENAKLTRKPLNGHYSLVSLSGVYTSLMITS